MPAFACPCPTIRLTALALALWSCNGAPMRGNQGFMAPDAASEGPHRGDASVGAQRDAAADTGSVDAMPSATELDASPTDAALPHTHEDASAFDAGDEDVGSDGGPQTIPVDPFGVRKIYPTKPNGREWYMNRDDVMADGIFRSVVAPKPNGDGTWYINTLRPGEPNQGARLDVTTPSGEDLWLNIEMTGYVRLISASDEQEFAWRTTSGTPHTNACDGYAYYATLLYSGERATVLKEVWHPNGYITGPNRAENPTRPLQGRWIGFKAIRYNVEADTKVRVELWLDDEADGQWRKLVETTDDGWVAVNAFPNDYDCANPLTGEPKTLDQVMSWPYPLVTFRADNAEFDFDKLSVREIEPPVP